MDSIAALARVLAAEAGASPAAVAALTELWRGGGASELADTTVTAARAMAVELERATRTPGGIAGRVIAADDATRAIVASWVGAVAGRAELVLAPLLTALDHGEKVRERVERAALRRIEQGPALDALACLPLTGKGEWLVDPEHGVARARLDMMLWEGGEMALSVPALGPWLFSHGPAIAHLVLDAAAGSLRQRAVAARALAIAADGARAAEIPRHLHSGTERILRRLASHPEAAVWIPAARALGRLAATLGDVHRLLLEWLDSDNLGERRRAVTALAAMPGGESVRSEERLAQLVAADDPWIVAALGPAIPYLACERRELWEGLVKGLDKTAAGAEVTFSVTQGLATLARRQPLDRLCSGLLARARARALSVQPRSATEAQLWQAIRADSDFVDDLEPDPSDPDRLLARHVSAALRVGARSIAERARFTARSLSALFTTALATAQGGEASRRAASCSTMESCARAAALSWWEPILTSAGVATVGLSSEVGETRAMMVREIAPRMAVAEPDHTFHRAALRVLAYACEERVSMVLDAVETAPWLSGSRREAGRFRKPVADVLWHVVDSTRSSALVSDPLLYPRFAAWWALSSSVGTTLLAHLERSEVAARVGQSRVFSAVEAIRAVLAPDAPGAVDGAWAVAVLKQLEELGAGDTNLAEAMAEVAAALDAAAESRTTLAPASLTMALALLDRACGYMRRLLADPRQALRPVASACAADDADGSEVDTLARTVRRTPGFAADDYAAGWALGLGPLLAPLIEPALSALLSAHAGLDATADTASPEKVGVYRLIRVLGEGEMGAVWLVCDPRTGRHFVMKLPAAAFATCSAKERARLEHAVALEAEVLRTIHHPNVASLIDYGWEVGTPYLVLEYLAGVDLEEYLAAGLLTLDECKPVVADICSGLLALHARGLVHRDLKPGNVFMRLDLGAPGARFEPRVHRRAPLLGAVIIDFGIAATGRAPSGARLVAGTLGFLAPEQARGDRDVDGKADVYGLAALVYASLTGCAFFEEMALPGRDWIDLHCEVAPLRDPNKVKGLPAGLAGLLRQASALEPDERPDVASFARSFAAL